LLRGEGRDVGSTASGLAEGLMLVRASNMKMLRLQLALERRDRGTALQTFDELIDLDARIANVLGPIPPDQDLGDLARDASEQRAKLLHEKFGLAAGLQRRSEQPGPASWIEPATPERDADEPPSVSATAYVQSGVALHLAAAMLALSLVAALLVLLLGLGPDTLPGWLERSLVR
jgi:hypothetical protein